MLQEYDHDKSDGDGVDDDDDAGGDGMVQSASATKWDKCGSTVNPMGKHKKCTIRAKHKCRSLNGVYPPAIKRGNYKSPKGNGCYWENHLQIGGVQLP